MIRLQPRRIHLRWKQDPRQPAISGKHQGSRLVREAPRQPAISGKHQSSRQSRGSTRAVSGKRRPEQSKVEGPSGCRSRIGVGRAKGSEEKGIRRARGARRDKGPGRIKRMKTAVLSFIRSLILKERNK